MSSEEYLVHISDLPSDITKIDIEEYFKQKGIEGVNVKIVKKHYKTPTCWAKMSLGNSENYNKVVNDMKYPRIKHDIESRLLENLTDGSLKNVADTNIVVKGLDKDHFDCAKLDEFFTQHIGRIKSCKVSKTIEGEGESTTSRSNGYGFVNFLTKEDCEKAISDLNGVEVEGSKVIIEKYNKDIKKEAKFNNLYVRGFDENFTEQDLVNMFQRFGELGSVKIMTDEEGNSKRFGFVCFKEAEPASRAVAELHETQLPDGNIFYVAKFEKKQNRWMALKKALSRSNLYVRNFDKDVTEEDLKRFFGGDQIVRNVRIMTTEVTRDGQVVNESKQFGFVSFFNPKDASDYIMKYNNEELEFNNKQLYVNYYEDKVARKKRLATKKERPENLFGMLDGSMPNVSNEQNNMMESIMNIFQQYFKQNNGNFGNYGYGGYQNYNQQFQGNYGSYGNNNRRGGRGRYQGGSQYNSYNSYGSYNFGDQMMYNRPPPRQNAHQSYATAGQGMMPPASNMPPSGAPPTGVPPAGMPSTSVAPTGVPPSSMPPASMPPVAQATTSLPSNTSQMMPPIVTATQPPQPMPPMNTPSTLYNNSIKAFLQSDDFKNSSEDINREKIGEEIYNFVLEKAGDDSAPKITGMIIDLPYSDLISSIQTYQGLLEKIQEGMDLLKDDQ